MKDAPLRNRIAAQLQRKGIRQFIKFCIVGTSSTLIDFSVANVAYYLLHVRPAALASVMGFCLAVVNGYFWNSRWTFRDRIRRAVHDEFIRFVAVNIIGALLNYSIVSVVLMLDPNDPHPKWVFNGAKLLATGIVVFWNFFVNRYWTFGRSRLAPTTPLPDTVTRSLSSPEAGTSLQTGTGRSVGKER